MSLIRNPLCAAVCQSFPVLQYSSHVGLLQVCVQLFAFLVLFLLPDSFDRILFRSDKFVCFHSEPFGFILSFDLFLVIFIHACFSYFLVPVLCL